MSLVLIMNIGRELPKAWRAMLDLGVRPPDPIIEYLTDTHMSFLSGGCHHLQRPKKSLNGWYTRLVQIGDILLTIEQYINKYMLVS